MGRWRWRERGRGSDWIGKERARERGEQEKEGTGQTTTFHFSFNNKTSNLIQIESRGEERRREKRERESDSALTSSLYSGEKRETENNRSSTAERPNQVNHEQRASCTTRVGNIWMMIYQLAEVLVLLVVREPLYTTRLTTLITHRILYST